MSQTVHDPADRDDPRIVRNRAVALAAATEILRAEGRDALTQARVASASGVSRATVYRLWPDRAQLVLDALGYLAALAHSTPAGHDVVEDLAAELFAIARQVDGPLRAVFATLIEQAQHDDGVAAVLADLQREGTRVLRQLLLRGRREGLVRTDVAVQPLVDQLVGAIVVDQLVRRRPATRAGARRAVAVVVAPVSRDRSRAGR